MRGSVLFLATALGALFLKVGISQADPVLPICSKATDTDCFTGKLGLVDIPPVEEDKDKALEYDFGFVDSTGTGWQTNSGDPTNGASIPKALQWIVGQPFDPLFVPASVIHDRYCDKIRSRRVYPWKATHRMFYEALLATGVSPSKARLMYYAVYSFGPRWTPAEIDAGHVCRGNLTPFCQQLIGESGSTVSSSDPKPDVPENPVELKKKYDITRGSGGKFDVYRKAIYDQPNVDGDMHAVKTILDATFSGPDAEKSSPEQQMELIENLSDTRHPAEAILLNEKVPNPKSKVTESPK
jgi:hypothetical protein